MICSSLFGARHGFESYRCDSSGKRVEGGGSCTVGDRRGSSSFEKGPIVVDEVDPKYYLGGSADLG
jgi:hypothetical protein